MAPQEQIDALKTLYPEVSASAEGVNEYIAVERLRLPDGCEPKEVKALLCINQRDGYPSRLFLSKKVTHKGKGQNWNANGVLILGQQWWAVSWKTNRPNLTLTQMIIDHL